MSPSLVETERAVLASVLTRVGMIEEGETGPLVEQGDVGASPASQLNLDMGINKYFVGSKDVDFYGSVRILPLTLQDDKLSGASKVSVVQAQNIKLDYILKEKVLDIHPDKSSYLVYGSTEYKNKVKAETEKDPLMLGDIELTQRNSKKYLGDILDKRGLEASVEETIGAGWAM